VSFDPSDDVKERVRQATDIVDLVGGYVPEMRREGRMYKVLCPWHNDTRPSLQINPERQSWKCWVCDLGGDVFSFVMQKEGMGFREALEMLAERANIELQAHSPDRPKPAEGSPEDKNTLYAAMAWAEGQFHECLLRSPEGQVARDYLRERDVSDESIAKFHVGFSPNEWTWLIDKAANTPFSPAVLEATGLALKSPKSGRPYDRFRGRALFSIRDRQGRPIALGGRVLPQFADDRSPKYINSPETPLFSKSNQLYGLDVARDPIAKSRQVLVMEGYTDVVAAHQFGLQNSVAVLGTALGERHVQLLRGLADSIVLLLDGDEAGRKRANEVLELFVAQQVDLKILTLPEGLDPADYLAREGREAMETLIAGAVDALDHKIASETRGVDLINDTHRAHQALESILMTMAKAPRMSAAKSSTAHLREQHILTRLARQFRLAEEEVRSRLAALRATLQRKSPTTIDGDSSDSTLAPRKFDPWERELLELLLQRPALVDRALEKVPVERFGNGPLREIYDIMRVLAGRPGEVTFEAVCLQFEQPDLKNLLVDLYERGNEKLPEDASMAAEHFDQLLVRYLQRETNRQLRAATIADSAGKLNISEKEKLILSIVQQQQDQQGISESTDG
jgi:DNA primase